MVPADALEAAERFIVSVPGAWHLDLPPRRPVVPGIKPPLALALVVRVDLELPASTIRSTISVVLLAVGSAPAAGRPAGEADGQELERSMELSGWFVMVITLCKEVPVMLLHINPTGSQLSGNSPDPCSSRFVLVARPSLLPGQYCRLGMDSRNSPLHFYRLPADLAQVLLEGPRLGQGRPAFAMECAGLVVMGVLRDSEWSGRFVGLGRPADVKEGTPLPFPWLRKTFELKEKPRRAMAYINPLGYYELVINGKKVDDHVLSPAVSDYSKRNLYLTHDVTDYLAAGKNCVALWLGRGWYVRGHPGVIHDGPLVRAQLDLLLPDGKTERIATDATWKVRESPLTPLGRGTAFGDYGGERYDARRELSGWNTAGLDDSDWKAAAVFEPPKVTTAAQMVQPNRIVQTIRPVKVSEFSPGVYLIDMGRNFTGWFELRNSRRRRGKPGVKLEYADFPPSGRRLATYNQRDEVIPRDGSEQVFCSRFNYHAFSFVRITGLKRPPSLEDARGYLIHTAYQPAAEFECSSDLLNRIYQTVTWTYRCLTMGGYVVDCPHREPWVTGATRGPRSRRACSTSPRVHFTASGPRTGGRQDPRTRKPATCPTRPPTTRTRGAAGRCGAGSSSRSHGSFTSSTETGGSSKSRIPASRSGSLSWSRRPSITCSSSTRASG